ncbi:Ies2p KNAG_0E02870 [Huiozyma naganishii CBS 8797]|uniref:INO80 complex subunit B-like conserved region domain-containing protein n=1 Tax=Huiozyma naganishii (strain ATCC MYA-139 / BCRC 22969 / CBS 8797 / KCTC 17520 / NBRC 10181 / NCYC 3082 / Yp74L-3) TaxID=1071383 RepID=J7S7X0_HUIN7|nr:hypothetical protein KNAG_0E02870 [Kazachstania naganishii CBS 8797]CCK70546.1 hypothetical protein KNAG_0E02870 [Kazachstania naganishii CBS 8797]
MKGNSDDSSSSEEYVDIDVNGDDDWVDEAPRRPNGKTAKSRRLRVQDTKGQSHLRTSLRKRKTVQYVPESVDTDGGQEEEEEEEFPDARSQDDEMIGDDDDEDDGIPEDIGEEPIDDEEEEEEEEEEEPREDADESREPEDAAQEAQLRRAETARKRKNMKDKKLEEEKRDTINKLLKKRASKTRAHVDDNSRGSAAVDDAHAEPGALFKRQRRPYRSEGMRRTFRTGQLDLYCFD